LRLNLTGTTAGARDLIVPAIQKPYLVNNGTADTITVKVSGQTGVAVPASTSMLLYNNGTDVIVAFNRVVGNVVGNLTGNVTGNVTGTASNATVLQTARNIQISGNVTAANVSFNGSADVNLSVTAINAAGITSGTLAVGRGGTGATSLNAEAVVIGNSTNAVKFVAPGTSGNVLTSNGSAWASTAPAGGGVTSLNGQTGAITNTNFEAIGSYIFAHRGVTNTASTNAASDVNANSTIAGSSLRYNTSNGITQTDTVDIDAVASTAWPGGGTAPTGTWRAMCRSRLYNSGNESFVWFPALWVRIS
jgi:hypothetical protein